MRVFLVLVAACSTPVGPDGPSDGVLVPVAPGASPHLSLGTPARAGSAEHLLVHDQLAAGFNRYLNASSWVSWRTRPEDFGPVERYTGNFYADDMLPAGWYQPVHDDLTSSGYDRGHMLRSEERTRTSAENRATFVMTNVLPQRPELNRGPWFGLEAYIQETVESSREPRDAYVVAGAVWPAECATDAPRRSGDGCVDLGRTSDPTRRIAIPSATWKLVVFVDAGVPLAEAADPYVVGVVMQNDSDISGTEWWEHRAAVAEVEEISGYDVPALE